MQILQNAGIYVLFILNGNTGLSYRSTDGEKYLHWDYNLYDNFQKTIDMYQKYQNTLGFLLSGKEVRVLIYAKSALSDLRDYMRKKKYRDLPIGWWNQVKSERLKFINSITNRSPRCLTLQLEALPRL
jgi:Glucanosyltransferase